MTPVRFGILVPFLTVPPPYLPLFLGQPGYAQQLSSVLSSYSCLCA